MNGDPSDDGFAAIRARMKFYVLKPQFMVIPRRHLGCKSLNQHNVPISEVIACNTNILLGDLSQMYYCTLFSSKSTQQEDKGSADGWRQQLAGEF